MGCNRRGNGSVCLSPGCPGAFVADAEREPDARDAGDDELDDDDDDERAPVEPFGLGEIAGERETRFPSGLAAWDEVLSGGLVEGATLLVGGAGGAGKTSDCLRIVASTGGLFASCEMPRAHLGGMAKRLRVPTRRVSVLDGPTLADVVRVAAEMRPRVLVLDSLPRVRVRGERMGSHAAMVAALAELRDLARAGTSVLAIVHATKAGDMAGAEALMHDADGLVWVEKGTLSVPSKWRFGPPLSVARVY
jgi:DNA repair protein RadA/Sms